MDELVKKDAIRTALEEFLHLVETVPNIRGETEVITLDYSPYGVLVTKEEELFTGKAFVSYFETDTLVQDTITLDGGLYEDHLVEAVSDIILEELERWRNARLVEWRRRRKKN